MAAKVATDNRGSFIDLHAISITHHHAIGREESMTYHFKEDDKTHFNRKGGEAIANPIIPEWIKIVPELAPACIAKEAVKAAPEK